MISYRSLMDVKNTKLKWSPGKVKEKLLQLELSWLS